MAQTKKENQNKGWKPDCITVEKWDCPVENDVRILTMPNVPFPLHGEGCQPRTIFGPRIWNLMRKQCYKQADDTCEVCGHKPDNLRNRHAHELFSYDYTRQKAKFERCVCLCSRCHIQCIHTGRALTLFEHHSPMMTREAMLSGAEHAFSLISEYNKAHPDQEPLRLFSTWIDFWKNKELHDDMERLIKQYDIKFYKVSNKWFKKSRWGEWSVNVGGVEHKTPYADAKEWEIKMTESNKTQEGVYNDNCVGGVFDEVDEILKTVVDK